MFLNIFGIEWIIHKYIKMLEKDIKVIWEIAPVFWGQKQITSSTKLSLYSFFIIGVS